MKVEKESINMIRTRIVKQIVSNDDIFEVGDIVKIVMNKTYLKQRYNEKKEYVGTITTITEEGGFLSYDNVTIPFNVKNLESIERIIG